MPLPLLPLLLPLILFPPVLLLLLQSACQSSACAVGLWLFQLLPRPFRLRCVLCQFFTADAGGAPAALLMTW